MQHELVSRPIVAAGLADSVLLPESRRQLSEMYQAQTESPLVMALQGLMAGEHVDVRRGVPPRAAAPP